MLKYILFVSCMLLELSESQQWKSGTCPPISMLRHCQTNCLMDFHCPSVQKCCRTACGTSYCYTPFFREENNSILPNNEINNAIESQDKPGFCPQVPSGPWVCSSRCTTDLDCRGTKKCCKNRCGANACARPEKNVNLF